MRDRLGSLCLLRSERKERMEVLEELCMHTVEATTPESPKLLESPQPLWEQPDVQRA